MSDSGIQSHGHRVMPQFGNASLRPLQASAPSVSFPNNNMHSSAHVLPPSSADLLQAMSSNIINGVLPSVPLKPVTAFDSLPPAFAGGHFSSSGVNPPPVFLSAPHYHSAPVNTQYNVPFVLL